MKPTCIFFIRRFNDIDHMVPIAYAVHKHHELTPLVLCQEPLTEIRNDYRLDFLREKGVTVDYVYRYFAPSVWHRIVGGVVCSSYMHRFSRSLLASIRDPKTGMRLLNVIGSAPTFAYSVFKRFLYPTVDRLLIEEYLFDVTWAIELLRHTKASVVVFDRVYAGINISEALIRAAQKLGIPTVSVPHGTQLFSGRPAAGPSDDHARVRNSGVDCFVEHHHPQARALAEYGFDPARIQVLGSPRYCGEWERILDKIVQPDPFLAGRNSSKLKVVYMERGADRHGDYQPRIRETLVRIASLDFVDFMIKPHPRRRLHVTDLPKSIVVADNIDSVNLCRWADVVIGTVSSILLEVHCQRKILLYPKYFHGDTMLFEEMGACWTINSVEELVQALERLWAEPTYRPYPQVNVGQFLKRVVYCDLADQDVLGRYNRFLKSVAIREWQADPKRTPDHERSLSGVRVGFKEA